MADTCSHCRRSPRGKKFALCDACRALATLQAARLAARRRRQGLCVNCGGPRDKKPAFNCSECLRKRREYWPVYYARHREAICARQRKIYHRVKKLKAERLARKAKEVA